MGQVIAIQWVKAQGQFQKAKAKRELKAKMDVEMADVIPNKKSLQQLIHTEISKSKLKPRPGTSKKPQKGKGKEKAWKGISDKKVYQFSPYR